MGPAASPTMDAIKATMTVFTIAAAPVAALVWAIADLQPHGAGGTAAAGRPRTPGRRCATTGRSTAAWLVVSSVLCALPAGLGPGRDAVGRRRRPRRRSPWSCDVTGQQWVWTFSYPGQGRSSRDQLYLPVNRPVVFHVTSNDVVHSFWVVQMGDQGRRQPRDDDHHDTSPPTGSATFDVRCAELCGLLPRRHGDHGPRRRRVGVPVVGRRERGAHLMPAHRSALIGRWRRG